jgi:hypothetical protein
MKRGGYGDTKKQVKLLRGRLSISRLCGRWSVNLTVIHHARWKRRYYARLEKRGYWMA